MIDFKTTKERVKRILEAFPSSRNNDNFLYCQVIEEIAREKGLVFSCMSVAWFFTNATRYGFPGFETVRRTRQKLQSEFPHLVSSEPVKALRTANEAEYRAFARSEV